MTRSYNHKTGEWAHATRLTRFPERVWLSNYSLAGRTAAVQPLSTASASLEEDVRSESQILEAVWKQVGRELELVEAPSGPQTKKAAGAETLNGAAVATELHALRWFILPEEALNLSDDFPRTRSASGTRSFAPCLRSCNGSSYSCIR